MWSNRSRRSFKKIYRERIARVNLFQRMNLSFNHKKRAIPSKNAFFVCILTVFPPLYVKRAYRSRRSLLFDLWIRSFGIKIYPVNLQKRSTGTIWSFLWSNRSFDHRKTPTWFSFLAQAFCFCKSTHPILSLIRIR